MGVRQVPHRYLDHIESQITWASVMALIMPKMIFVMSN